MKQSKQRTTASWLFEFAGNHKPKYAISVITAVLSVVCGILPYFCMSEMIYMLLDGVKDIGAYKKYFIILAALWTGKALFHGLSTALSHRATFAVLGEIRKKVCAKLFKVPMGYILDTPSGELKNTIVERIDSMEPTMAHIVPEFTSNLLAPIGLFIYLFTLDWRMALAALITLPIGMICFMGMMSGYDVQFKESVEKTKVLNDTAIEYINGIEVIKAFGKAQSSYDKFIKAARENAQCFITWMRRCNVFFCLAMAVMPATMLGILPIGGILYRNGSLSAADFIQIIIISISLISSLITLMSYTDDLGKIKTIVGEVTGILSHEDLVRPEKSRSLPSDCSIVMKDVTFGYNDKEVLHGINLEMKDGTVNAFVGPSGSGKSTVAKLVASLWDIKSGSITIGGTDIRDMSLEDYNRYIAYVSQDNFLFDDTIMENIRMGRKDATDEEVIDAAKRCGCHDFIMGLENGYNTVVGGAGGHLSGGERQRIAIARAMFKDAPIVILDEATAYTDPENEAIIQSSVAKLVKGKTLIVIAHRLSTIIDSDNIFVIKDGKVESSGTHEELLAKHGLYEQMWKAHISVKDTAEGEYEQMRKAHIYVNETAEGGEKNA